MTTTVSTDVLTTACDAGFYNGNATYSKPAVRESWKQVFASGVSLTDAIEAFRNRVSQGIAETKPSDLDKVEQKFLSNGYQRSLYLGYAMSKGITAETASLAAKFVDWSDLKETVETSADLATSIDLLIELGEAKAEARKDAKELAAVDIVLQTPAYLDVLTANIGKDLSGQARAELFKAQAVINSLLAK